MEEGRGDYSQLFGFWYTEAGPLNQVVHIWPYESLEERAQVRAKAVEDGVWPPNNTEFVLNMNSEIFLPAPFMENRGAAKLGPVYEMRIYKYEAERHPEGDRQVGGAYRGAAEVFAAGGGVALGLRGPERVDPYVGV